MKKITEITKRDIFDIIRGGYRPSGTNEVYKISWYGELNDVKFLERLYDLYILPSKDRRYRNARSDINQHRAEFSDWEDNWIFNDDRFGLVDGDDEILLDFLCEIFHPVVRKENQSWRLFVEAFNNLLKYDGYELYENGNISGRVVYGWRDMLSKNVIAEKQAEILMEKFNSEYLGSQIKIMYNTIETSPYDAIGKAKELFESCCKTILKESNIKIGSDWDVIRLTKETCKVLKLTPDDIPDTTKASETIKKLLGNLSAISQSIAELRNSYGSGHGKEAEFKGLNPRHAQLAVSSAVSAVHFLWGTFEEKPKEIL